MFSFILFSYGYFYTFFNFLEYIDVKLKTVII